MPLSDRERRDHVREHIFRARIETMILERIEARLEEAEADKAREIAESIMDSVYTAISARWYQQGIRDREEMERYGG